jgi:hypothetical protein
MPTVVLSARWHRNPTGTTIPAVPGSMLASVLRFIVLNLPRKPTADVNRLEPARINSSEHKLGNREVSVSRNRHLPPSAASVVFIGYLFASNYKSIGKPEFFI